MHEGHLRPGQETQRLGRSRPLIRHVETLARQDEWIGPLQDTIDEHVTACADIIWMPANSSEVGWHKLDMLSAMPSRPCNSGN
jgi:hypothetical protein